MKGAEGRQRKARRGNPVRSAERHGGVEQFYPTPAPYTPALLQQTDWIEAGARVWEPAAGRGDMARPMRAAGLEVVASDLVDRGVLDVWAPVDFLAQREAWAPLIVTNPPYGGAAAPFIRHGLALGCRVVVLLPLSWLEGVRRSDLIDGALRRVAIGRDRGPFMGAAGIAHTLDKAAAAFGWFEFVPGHPGGWTGQRVSWFPETATAAP